MPLTPGEPAPWFRASTPTDPEFTFDSVAGRFVLLAFLPRAEQPRRLALEALAKHRKLFDDARLSAFAIVRDEQTAAGARDMRGLRWVFDLDGAVSCQFDAVEPPDWMLLDPALRVLRSATLDETADLFASLAALPAPGEHAGVPLHAPVLIAPRIFEPEFCQELIALHQAGQAELTGVMRDRGERTAYVMDVLKKRRDVLIVDPHRQAAIRERLERRLFPQIERALGFQVTRIERYLISCYDAEDGGVFHAHRDNTTFQTAHRKFAGSINLNDDFDGGDLRFPEFGARTYRPPVGGSCVFSCGVLHEATRVARGRRYAFLPFFYDEAGEAVMREYRARVAAADAPAA